MAIAYCYILVLGAPLKVYHDDDSSSDEDGVFIKSNLMNGDRFIR